MAKTLTIQVLKNKEWPRGVKIGQVIKHGNDYWVVVDLINEGYKVDEVSAEDAKKTVAPIIECKVASKAADKDEKKDEKKGK